METMKALKANETHWWAVFESILKASNGELWRQCFNWSWNYFKSYVGSQFDEIAWKYFNLFRYLLLMRTKENLRLTVTRLVYLLLKYCSALLVLAFLESLVQYYSFAWGHQSKNSADINVWHESNCFSCVVQCLKEFIFLSCYRMLAHPLTQPSDICQ